MIGLERITEIVKEHLEQATLGLDKESLKFDFKYEWYDLSTLKGVNEYLKDTTAMANTYGLDGFIVIGFDDRRILYKDVTFEDCGLRDTNEITKVLIKRVSHLFELNTYDIIINGHKLSVIHIPPAWEKPILIRNYQTFTKRGNIKKEYHQKIFVRKNTGTFSATKYDIDLMYYDRKNVEPDYRLFIDIFKLSVLPLEEVIQLKFTVENAGRRPVAIVDFNLIFSDGRKDLECQATKIWGQSGLYSPKHSSEIVQPNNIQNLSVEFTLPNNQTDQFIKKLKTRSIHKQIILKLSNDKILSQKFELPE
ncbi:MAG: ATP-binding protein [Aureispira sp.]|nr:ATP-binding protein [Aureispira sp.]